MADIYNDQLIRARHIHGASAAPLPPFQSEKITIPTSLSSISSIAPAKPREDVFVRPTTRPKLSEPEIAVVWALAEILVSQEQLTLTATQNLRHDLQIIREHVERNRKERNEAIEKESKAVVQRSTWSVLSKIAGYFTAAGLGSAAFASGSAVLALAAVLAATKELLDETNLKEAGVKWYTTSEELQDKIKARINALATVVEAGLILTAWQNGAFSAVGAAARAAPLNTAIEKAGTIISTAGAVMGYGGQFGMTISDREIDKLRALLARNNGSTTLLNQNSSDRISEFKINLETDLSNMDVIQEAGASLNRVSTTE